MPKEQHLGVGERLSLWVVVHECTDNDDNKTENNHQHTPLFEVCSHPICFLQQQEMQYGILFS